MPISVTITNVAPTAADDSIDVTAGQAVASVLDNDVDPDGSNAASSRSGWSPRRSRSRTARPARSRSWGIDSSAIDPGAGRGTATFTYTVRDADGAESAPATVTVVGPRLNTAPFANDQTRDVVVGTALDVALDVGDADGDPLTLHDLTDPSPIVTAQAGFTLTVTPADRGHLRDHLPRQRRARVLPYRDDHDHGDRPGADRRRRCRRQTVTGDRVELRSDRRLSRQRARCQRLFGSAIAASIASRHCCASWARRSGRFGAP